jgi:hypothetical protein
MTAPQFTPGPWHVVGRAEEYNLAVCAPRPGNEDRLDSVLGDEHAEANARLIAAAPELYEALEALRSYGCPVCQGDCGSANPPVVSCPTQQASAALAKARGEA